jgi:streptomycin 6-kinase
MSPGPDLGPLERIAREVAAEWHVELGPRFALSRHSYVAPAGGDAVLKVRAPEDDESDEEADALALWNGDGAVRLLRRDDERRAILIERARPGTDISKLPEDEATAIAVEVGLRLWRPAGEPFRWIGDHVPRWLDNKHRALGRARVRADPART